MTRFFVNLVQVFSEISFSSLLTRRQIPFWNLVEEKVNDSTTHTDWRGLRGYFISPFSSPTIYTWIPFLEVIGTGKLSQWDETHLVLFCSFPQQKIRRSVWHMLTCTIVSICPFERDEDKRTMTRSALRLPELVLFFFTLFYVVWWD